MAISFRQPVFGNKKCIILFKAAAPDNVLIFIRNISANKKKAGSRNEKLSLL